MAGNFLGQQLLKQVKIVHSRMIMEGFL
jgi:hypothetical protein